MLRRHHDRPVPVIAWQHHQIVIQMQRFSSNSEVGVAFRHGFSDLGWRTLMHMQRHPRIAFNKALDHPRQGIARLGMGGRHIQRPLVRPGMLPGDRFDGIDF